MESTHNALGFDSEFTCWELGLLALSLESHSRCIAFAQCTSQCASLLRSQVEWLEFLALVELAEIVLCLLVHDNVHTGDGFAHNTTEMRMKVVEIRFYDFWCCSGKNNSHSRQLGWSSAGDFGDTKCKKLIFELLELLGQLFLVLLTKF